MAGQFRGKVAETMNAHDGEKSVGDRVAEGTERGAGDTGSFADDKGIAGIRDHMDVIASCGTKVGVVDHVEAGTIKLTKKDSPDGKYHFIPTTWVNHVDNQVHLSRNSLETEREWTNDVTIWERADAV